MVPIGIVAGALNWNPTAVFTINFFAIIPLAAVLSFATEMLASKLGQAMGGLLNATFGNAVELIVCAIYVVFGLRLRKKHIRADYSYHITGQHCRPERWPDCGRAVINAWFHIVQLASCYGNVLPFWWISTPRHQWRRQRAVFLRRRRPDDMLPHDAILCLSCHSRSRK